MAKPDGGYAFPSAFDAYEDGTGSAERGMKLRDYFAGQWLVGASQYWANTDISKLAVEAYRMADAMIAEREKGGQ